MSPNRCRTTSQKGDKSREVQYATQMEMHMLRPRGLERVLIFNRVDRGSHKVLIFNGISKGPQRIVILNDIWTEVHKG